MHELSITQEIVKVVDDARRGAGEETRLLKVTLCIGHFTAVVPDCVSFYFEMMTKDTPMEGAELVFKEVPLEVRCGDCGRTFEGEPSDFTCPSCGGGNTEIIAGRELFVESIEVSD